VSLRASVEDIHATARAMPHVTTERPDTARPIYQVGSKTFVFFRTPRPDAVDPETGKRYEDVIVIWVASEGDKQALVQDEDLPFFTTPHSTATRRSCSARPGCPRSTATSWSRSCRRRGWRRRPPDVVRHGWSPGAFRSARRFRA
jgi:hypothetical protein